MKDTPVAAIDPIPVSGRDEKPVGRLRVVQFGLLAFALVIVAQLVRWQVIQRDAVLEDATRGALSRTTIPPQRGLILDRDRGFLALNDYAYVIEASPKDIPDEETLDVARRLADILDLSTEELYHRLHGKAVYAPVARNVPKEIGEQIIALKLNGISVQPVPSRMYPEHMLAAGVLGFVNAEGEGFYGLEGFYDTELKGEAGLREERWDPWTQPVSFADSRSSRWKMPQAGHTLILNIDRTVQYLIEKELQRAVAEYGATSGCIVVMDPKTGAILAMAGYPSYDPNDYARYAATNQELFVDPIVASQYEPGSTFKVVTMAAALDTGVVKPSDVYYDAGWIEVGGRIIHNWDNRAYGNVTMTEVMVHSLNTGMANVALLLEPSRFYHYVERFGFGRKTGIDIQGEVGGTVRKQGDPEWHESDLGTNAFGQGLAVTPLQMVVAVGAIANRGFLMQPYVVSQLVRDDQVVNAKQVAIRQAVSEWTAKTVTEMMVQVIERGATLAQVEGYQIAGKTGTAETPVGGQYDPNLTIASFIGFAPVDDPQFVALVKLDAPTASPWGATTAAPTFARVARILFTQLAIPPDGVQLAAH